MCELFRCDAGHVTTGPVVCRDCGRPLRTRHRMAMIAGEFVVGGYTEQWWESDVVEDVYWQLTITSPSHPHHGVSVMHLTLESAKAWADDDHFGPDPIRWIVDNDAFYSAFASHTMNYRITPVSVQVSQRVQ